MNAISGSEIELVAHGGVGGAFIEVGLIIGILFIFGAVWLRERRANRRGDADENLTDNDLFRDKETDDDT